MKLHQLRYLCEVIDSGLSVSRASARLHTSPSGISKQLKILEDELGAVLLTRRNTRITGVTRTGEAALPLIRRVLQDVEHVRRVSREASGQTTGVLRIGTTHTNACYALVSTIKAFATRFALGLLETPVVEVDSSASLSLAERTRLYEASLIRDVLTRCDGDVSTAIAELQLPRKTFYDKLGRHGIDISRFRRAAKADRPPR